MRAISSSGLETCGATFSIEPRRHPSGFILVCASVAFERFSMYLLLSLLLLYLTGRAGFSVAGATNLVGYFVGLSYLTSLLGGILADRLLGHWGAGVIGTAVATAGYAALMFDGAIAIYGGLGLIAIGGGVYKASPQALTDRLYSQEDSRRDAGFNLLYIVVNVGAFLGPVTGEAMRCCCGWRGAFAVASLGMIASHLSLLICHQQVVTGKSTQVKTGKEQSTASILPHRRALIGLCLTALLFTIAQMQVSSTLLLWARDNTDRYLFGWEVPVAYFAAMPALLIIFLAPILSCALAHLRRRGSEPRTAAKLRCGMLVTALAYVPMFTAALLRSGQERASMLWLLACLLGIAAGELLVPALGPSLLTKLAPPQRRAMWLGIWFGSMAIGSIVAGKLGTLWGSLCHGQYFALLILIPIVGAVIASIGNHCTPSDLRA